MTTTTATDRDWDLDTIFPGIDSPEFQRAFDSALSDLGRLGQLFDERGTDEGTPKDQQAAVLDALLPEMNRVFDALDTLGAYLYCLTTVDSRDDAAKAKQSEFEGRAVLASKLESRFERWAGTLELPAVLASSQVARDHEYFLTRAQTFAAHQMSAAEEDLAAELNLSGGSPWARLREDVTSQIEIPFELDGVTKPLTMSEIRNLAEHPDADVRKRAYHAELAAWEGNALPIAAALNGIKGEAGTLIERRGWSSPVAQSAFQNGIDEATLDAMMTAARDSFPAWRRYFQAKARMLGQERLAWWNILAPLGEAGRAWEYDEGKAFVAANFDAYSQRMGDHARRAFRERWLDVDPKPGKGGGAWAAPIRGDEARVLLNYSPSFSSVNTLAHELGHVYHDLNLATRTRMQRITPSTLAETASTFCETIIRHAATQNVSPQEELAILDGALQSAAMCVVDISSRFNFEKSVFERRAERELSIDEFSDLMLAAQQATYGDSVDSATYHRFMWAAKPHYYDVNEGFYNFPYMFGLLFGLGLYAQYLEDPDRFRSGYDELLSMTGMADAATLAGRFGFNLRDRAFWDASLAILARDIDRFFELVATTAAPS
jgi:pepF/M3 family oligoendopeptidase